jgi:DNA-binding NarL/FixJ family response regulator
MPKSILIADDHTATRKALHAALERVGFAVCAEAVDGVDAVEKASNASPDLILLDFRMPRLNGIEAASILHQKLPSTPIVILTMFDVVRASQRPAELARSFPRVMAWGS